jgi:cytochrome c
MIFAFRTVLIAALASGAATAAPTAIWAQPAAPADFSSCGFCHETKPDAAASLGPNLFGVGGRVAGSVAGYDYSDAMKKYAQPWTADNLAAFILDPAKTVPGNKMDFPGANDAASAKAIADYLMSLKP